MRKKLSTVIVLVLVMSVAFSMIASANYQTQRRLFDADGNEVFGGGVYYDENRIPVFGPGCWYLGENGSRTDARGMDAFMRDAEGNLIPAPYGAWCWGFNDGLRGRRGCGRWR